APLAVPGPLEELGQRMELVGELFGQDEHGLVDAAEVLVEGRGRRADLAGHLDHAQLADAVALEQVGGGVEEAPAGLLSSTAERPAVDGHRRHPENLTRRQIIGMTLMSGLDRKSTRLNSSHVKISYAVFC